MGQLQLKELQLINNPKAFVYPTFLEIMCEIRISFSVMAVLILCLVELDGAPVELKVKTEEVEEEEEEEEIEDYEIYDVDENEAADDFDDGESNVDVYDGARVETILLAGGFSHDDDGPLSYHYSRGWREPFNQYWDDEYNEDDKLRMWDTFRGPFGWIFNRIDDRYNPYGHEFDFY